MYIAENAHADKFKLTPFLEIKEEYNDNIHYSSTGKQKDFISTLSPGFALTDKTERMVFSLLGRLDHRLYSNHNKFNVTNQYYEGSYKYAFTTKLNLSGKVIYSVNSDPDSDFLNNGLFLTSVKRTRQNYVISGDYRLSEKAITTFSYDYFNDKYEEALLTDSENSVINIGFIHDMNNILEATKARINMGYTESNIPGMKIDNYKITTGIDHAINEKWRLLVDGGSRYTRSQFIITESVLAPLLLIKREDKNSGWATVGQLVLTYKGERDNGSISASIDLLPASGYWGSTERTSFIFNLSRRFTHELYGTLSGGFYINKSRAGKFSTKKIDEDTISFAPSIRYEFDKDKYIEASYTYNRTRYNVIGGKSQRNIYFVRFRMQHHLFK